MNKDQREIARKLRILHHAKVTGHVAKTCRYFGVGRSSFYRWREAYRKHGEAGRRMDVFPVPYIRGFESCSMHSVTMSGEHRNRCHRTG